MCAQTASQCFIFDADLIELLHQSGEELCAAVASSFLNSADLEIAAALITSALIDSAVMGERNASAWRLAALKKLQLAFPSVAIGEALALPLTPCPRRSSDARF
jgi:ABC-type tungstate transport system substrate-binding protein